MEILKIELDPDQLSAAANLDQPLLVLAGPGSGKTRLLTQRIGYIFRSVPRKDFKVLALTFTNKAAREVTERLALMPGYQKERAFVGTFHRFCQELLHSYACYIDRSRRFTILDPDDQHALLGQCLAEVGLTRIKPEGIKSAIERAQRQMLSPEDYAKLLVGKGQSARPAEVYRVYEARKRVSEVVDFNDLLLLSIALLRDVPAIRRIYQDVFEFVCIDECQDTTLAQLELIKLLVPQGSTNLLVVADEDQLIYEWNEARVENLNELEVHYGLTVFNLNRNYRCPPDVLDLANKLIIHNTRRFSEKKKGLIAIKEITGRSYTVLEATDEEEEAAFVLQTIRDEMETNKNRQYGDFAIIARNRFVFERLKESLTEEGIPFVLFGDEHFLQQREVTVYLHAFTVVHNCDDVESFTRLCVYLDSAALPELSAIQSFVYQNGKRLSHLLALEETIPGVKNPERFLWVKRFYWELQALSKWAGSIQQLFQKVEALLRIKERLHNDKSNEVETKRANIEAFEEFIAGFDGMVEDRSLSAFNAEVLLKRSSTDRSSVDKVDPATVKLLTIHTGKGTEYPIVFLMGLEEGTLPDYRSDTEQKIEEERRNCYVAVTRTMEHLYLSWCASRTNQYGTWEKEPSRFLIEMTDMET